MRGTNVNVPVLDSFGLEIETEYIVRGSLPVQFRNKWREEHDASIETPIYFSDIMEDIYIKGNNNDNDVRKGIIGDELVSTILDFNDPESFESIRRLTDWIYNSGESEESDRSGIHIHLCMPHNKSILHNLAVLTGFTEQLFYYIGGMGYEFRGIKNDSTYCRPLTKFGPPVLHSLPRYQAFNLENMIRADSVQEFFDGYGINYEEPPGKYNPSRYTWFTFYPLLTKSTVELRVLNKTLNPNYIISVVKFFRQVCSASLRYPEIDLPIRSIYDPHTKNELFYDFETLLSIIGGLDQKTEKTITKIISRTPMIELEKAYVYTHLKDGYYKHQFRYFDPTYITSPVRSPKFVDLHALRR